MSGRVMFYRLCARRRSSLTHSYDEGISAMKYFRATHNKIAGKVIARKE